jgi:hypothetical protein
MLLFQAQHESKGQERNAKADIGAFGRNLSDAATMARHAAIFWKTPC